MMTRPIRVGDTVRIPEEHYEWGTGDLTVRVTAFEADQDAGPAWVRVRGVEIDRDGAERRERVVLARRSGMRRVPP